MQALKCRFRDYFRVIRIGRLYAAAMMMVALRFKIFAAMLLIVGAFASLPSSQAATFQIVDPVEFNKIINTNAVLVTNATINTWLEGPTWIPSGGGYLVFCDQGNNRLKKLVPPNTLTDFLVPPANTLYNGTILDAQERLLGAQAGSAGRRIVMITNGVPTTLVSTCKGLQFYSPNDVIVKSDGTIWFTDPGYNSGIVYANPPPIGFPGGYHVYQCNPTNGNASCVVVVTNSGNAIRPNGLCFSPDETKLYVADSGSARCIRVYSISSSNTLSGGSVFAAFAAGMGNPDGIRCDVDGRVWSSAANGTQDGVHIFAPDGHLIGKIIFHRTANLCFGGPEYKTLYMTGQPVVTSIPVLVAGALSLRKLQATFDSDQLNLSWPAPSTGFALQESDQLDLSGTWTNSDLTLVVTNGNNQVRVEPTNTAKYFRLRLN